MINKSIFTMFLILLIALFFSCNNAAEDDIDPVTKLQATVTYAGSLNEAGANLSVTLYEEIEEFTAGSDTYILPATRPTAFAQEMTVTPNTPMTVTLTSITITEGYIFAFINVDGELNSMVEGDPYIYYNNKTGLLPDSSPDIFTLTEGEVNTVELTIIDSVLYPALDNPPK